MFRFVRSYILLLQTNFSFSKTLCLFQIVIYCCLIPNEKQWLFTECPKSVFSFDTLLVSVKKEKQTKNHTGILLFKDCSVYCYKPFHEVFAFGIVQFGYFYCATQFKQKDFHAIVFAFSSNYMKNEMEEEKVVVQAIYLLAYLSFQQIRDYQRRAR